MKNASVLYDPDQEGVYTLPQGESQALFWEKILESFDAAAV